MTDRKEFEKWATHNGLSVEKFDDVDDYIVGDIVEFDESTAFAWRAWQAQEKKIDHLTDALEHIRDYFYSSEQCRDIAATALETIPNIKDNKMIPVDLKYEHPVGAYSLGYNSGSQDTTNPFEELIKKDKSYLVLFEEWEQGRRDRMDGKKPAKMMVR